jgi:DNA-binding ferritin-like protein
MFRDHRDRSEGALTPLQQYHNALKDIKAELNDMVGEVAERFDDLEKRVAILEAKKKKKEGE